MNDFLRFMLRSVGVVLTLALGGFFIVIFTNEVVLRGLPFGPHMHPVIYATMGIVFGPVIWPLLKHASRALEPPAPPRTPVNHADD